MKLLRLFTVVFMIGFLPACATQGLIPISSPRAQVLEAYNTIESVARTRDELVRASIINAEEWGKITAELRRALHATTEYDQVLRLGGADDTKAVAFRVAREVLLQLRGQLVERAGKGA